MKGLIKNIINYIVSRKPHDVYVTNVTLSRNQLLCGRTALITGGTSGIGFAIAEAFLNAGAKVIITGRNLEKLEKSVNTLKLKTNRTKSNIMGIKWDITTDCIDSKYTDIINQESFSNIDILINNAGIGGGNFKSLESEFDKIIETNLKSAFFLSKFIGEKFIENNTKGNILFISSSSAIRPAISPYMLSKWSIRGLTQGLAKVLSPHGITVNSIAPGPTATPMLADSNNSLVLDSSPLRRYILPEEIANMAVFLVSEMGRSVIGETIYMTGGAGLITFDDIKYPNWK